MELANIVGGGVGAFVVILTLIQIAPIKINPWSAIARALGRSINREVLDKVDALGDEVKALQSEVSEQAAVNARTRILHFGDELLHDVKHSKEHFDQTLRDIKAYELYCEEHPSFENNVTEQISVRIKAVYQNCLKNNDFF